MQEMPRIESIDRALALLLALAEAGPLGSSLGELSGQTGVNKSTAYRALSTMRGRGFVTQSVDGATYRLGPAAMSLGGAFVTPEHLTESMHPVLVAVSRASEELVHLGVWVDDHVLYIDKVEPARAIRVWSSVGQRVPIATSALGRAMLAGRNVDEEQQKLYLQPLGAERRVTAERLRAAVRQARRRGYSTELEENEPGIGCLGTAIMRGNHVVAALSITAPSARMTARRQVELAELIRNVVPPLLPDGLSLMPVGQ
jgi:DNA-binding IclR family transcriptional regulator